MGERSQQADSARDAEPPVSPGPPQGGPERVVLTLLHRLHMRLAARAERLTAAERAAQSFCSEWSVAQVYSHLGSGAEIGGMALAAVRKGGAPPDPRPVWDRWDAKPPGQMVDDFAPADAAYLTALSQAVDAAENGEHLVIPVDGRPWPLVVVLTARLTEMALHEWDVAVAENRSAEVDADAAAWVLAAFPLDVAAQAVPPEVAAHVAPLSVEIEIGQPRDLLRLDLSRRGTRLQRVTTASGCDARIELPNAGAYTRMVTGRWRPEVDDDRARFSGQVSGRVLTRLFPGF